ncbi:MAG: glycosyltransferase family 4 protein [bacterium]
MKLLILTQKVDLNDDVLGFFHSWLFEFAKNYEKITVVCLEKGECNLPENVKIFSLGKEKIRNWKLGIQYNESWFNNFQFLISNFSHKIRYISRFYKLIWKHRTEYDYIFVHMNPEYVVLGGILWKLWRKKIILWYNHREVNFLAKIAGKLANFICYTSPFSFFSAYSKAKLMPVGIDTELFRRDCKIEKDEKSLFFLGRISPVKRIETLIEAAKILRDKGNDFELNIIGAATEKDTNYLEKLKQFIKKNNLEEKINFLGSFPNFKTPEIFNKNGIFINMTNSGSMDKTIIEAMACETMILICNSSFGDIFSKGMSELLMFEENNSEDLASKILKLSSLDTLEKTNLGKKLREIAVNSHDIKITIQAIGDLLK